MLCVLNFTIPTRTQFCATGCKRRHLPHVNAFPMLHVHETKIIKPIILNKKLFWYDFNLCLAMYTLTTAGMETDPIKIYSTCGDG